MEVDILELRKQGDLFNNSWFKEAGEHQRKTSKKNLASKVQSSALEELRSQSHQQQGCLAAIAENMKLCNAEIKAQQQERGAIHQSMTEVQQKTHQDFQSQMDRMEKLVHGKMQRTG